MGGGEGRGGEERRGEERRGEEGRRGGEEKRGGEVRRVQERRGEGRGGGEKRRRGDQEAYLRMTSRCLLRTSSGSCNRRNWSGPLKTQTHKHHKDHKHTDKDNSVPVPGN